jgi:hypothetical protein
VYVQVTPPLQPELKNDATASDLGELVYYLDVREFAIRASWGGKAGG